MIEAGHHPGRTCSGFVSPVVYSGAAEHVRDAMIGNAATFMTPAVAT
jgi:hypothetical protein